MRLVQTPLWRGLLLVSTSLIATHGLSTAWDPAAIASCKPENSPTVLLVLDPNGILCWENVAINEFTNSTLLPWLHKQRDALTLGTDRKGTYLKTPAGKPAWVSETFWQHVEEAWQAGTAYIHLPSMLLVAFQMTMLEESCIHLRLTDEQSFWASVEMTAAAALPVPADVHYLQQMQQSPDTPEPLLDSMQDTVIILPRIVPTLRPIFRSHSKQTLSSKYADPAEWDLETVSGMIERFLKVTHATSLPRLEEYRIVPDKMQLQDMYQSYYDADPENRTPPIPTAQVVPPVSTQRLQQLCYSHTRVPTEAELTDTAYAILDALHELETTVPQGDRIRGVVERSGASFYASPGLQWMGEYMIKREFSEGSHHVFGISLPKLLPEPIEASHCHTDLNLQHTNASTTMTSHNMATDMGNPEQSSLTSCPLDQDAEPVQITIPSYVWQLLWETASRLLTESCGESWLLQPKIASMTRLEYRVYLLGGVSGAQESSSHSVVVYTPCLLDPDVGIRTYNVTLPEGTFCSDTMADPGDDPDLMDIRDFTQITPWSSPDTYNLIVKAAHDGAAALVASSEGHLLKMVNNVFVRIDVVLGSRWLNNEEVELLPMVNEMDWLNSAGMLTHFWKDPDASQASHSSLNASATSAFTDDVTPARHAAHAGVQEDGKAGFGGAVSSMAAAAVLDSAAAASIANNIGMLAHQDQNMHEAAHECTWDGKDVYMEALEQSPGYKVARALYAEVLRVRKDEEAV